jgi:hypothetical protein
MSKVTVSPPKASSVLVSFAPNMGKQSVSARYQVQQRLLGPMISEPNNEENGIKQ